MEQDRFQTEGRFENKEMRSTKEDEFVYAPKSETKFPQELKDHFEEMGFRLRWVRYLDGDNRIDTANLRRSMHQDGFEFVAPSELPNGGSDLGELQSIDRYGECVTLGQLVMMKVPVYKAEARKKYFEVETKKKMDATNELLRRNAIENGSKTVTRTGKRATYAAD